MSRELAARVRGLRRTVIRELFESAPDDAINLGLGQPDMNAPSCMRRALAEVALEGASGYGPTAGDRELRAHVAKSYEGFANDADDILITTGCQQATFALIGAIADESGEVLVPQPGFPGAERVAHAWGAKTRTYALRPENDHHIDPDEVIDSFGAATRALVVITPSNPTGTVEPLESLRALSRGCAERGLFFVIDDTYRRLSWTKESVAPGVAQLGGDHVVACGGLSKSHALAGWRVGWIATTNRQLMEKLIALQQTLLTCAPLPLQIASREAFSTEGERGVAAILDRFRARRDWLVEKLGESDFVAHAPLEGAFYAWLRVSDDSSRFCRALLDRDGIVVIPGAAFGKDMSNWIRVSYAQCRERLEPAFTTLLARVSRGWR